jgi:LmbE family N-acetylglucosaminyl deacetylase
MPGVVLSPHPDDAVLGAWTRLRAGDARVCNVCTAVPPPGTLSDLDRLFGVDDSSDLVARRLTEDAAALQLAGCDGADALGFLDHQYRLTPIAPTQLGLAVARSTNDASWLCAPAGIGANPDHVAVRNAALAIARERGTPIELYAELPDAVPFGWPGWVSGRSARPYLVPDARWTNDLPSNVALEPRPIALDAAEIACKLRALECYLTQLAALNAGPLDRITHPEIIGFELRWRVSFA